MKKSDTPFLDRVFLHSKNADERLFDMILRIITFIVLIIILWLYADLTHAKADTLYNDVVSFVYHDNALGFSEPYLNEIDYLTAINAYPDIPSGASFLGIGSFRPLITSSMDLDNNFVILSGTPTDQYSYYALFLIPKDVVLNGDFVLCDQYHCYIRNSFDFTCFEIPHNSVSATSTYNEYHWNTDSRSGYLSFGIGLQNSQNDWGVYFTNIPMLFGTNSNNPADIEDWLENGNNENVFNGNYLTYHDLAFSPSNAVESDANHLYLKDYSIGLTSSDFLLDSNLIISAKWDNWVEKYISHYKMVIVYSLDYNGEPWSRTDVTPPIEQPFHWMVTDTVPLGKFASYYSIGIRDIFSRMGINDQSAVAICNALQQSGAIIATENGSTTVQDVLNGLTAEYKVSTNGIGASGGVNLGVLYAFLHEQLDTLHAGETTVFIDDFRLNVYFYLISDRLAVGDASGSGSAEFNFLSGTTDYTYDILNNNNEWSEPNKPNINNETASSSSSGGDISNSNIAYGGNANSTVGDITISTGNGYKDTELHQLTDQDIVHNHQKIITVIEDLKYCFHQFAQENNHNSFMQMIIDDYGQIPGVEYIATSIIILCGVCILIFIIKIAF